MHEKAAHWTQNMFLLKVSFFYRSQQQPVSFYLLHIWTCQEFELFQANYYLIIHDK